MIIQLPFAGFYQSIHDDAIDRAYEYIIEDESGDPIESLVEELWQHIDNAASIPYAKAYVEAFNDYVLSEHGFDLNLEFESLDSPREYNFTTDRIFCNIPEKSVIGLRQQVNNAVLDKTISDMFTSCDGFISSYPNTLGGWINDVTTWDHNELMTLLIAWLQGKGEDMQELDMNIFDYGDLHEAAAFAVAETMNDELMALAEKAQKITGV